MNKITFIMLLLLAGCSSTTWVWHKEDMSNFAEDKRACENSAQESWSMTYLGRDGYLKKNLKRLDEEASQYPMGSTARASMELRKTLFVQEFYSLKGKSKRRFRSSCLNRRGYTLLPKES